MIEQIRLGIARAVLDRVAGPGAPRRTVQVGWFGPDSPVRTVHGDVSMFVGGLRAILLQSLHPQAMAGVAQHSDYRRDPWGRLQRTAAFLGETTFGTADQAEHACAVVRNVHTRVTGIGRTGQRYSANDPHLLEWVHIAEVDSFLSAHRTYGERRLTPHEADTYVAQMGRVAIELGVLDPPASVAELAAAFDRFRPELKLTREAADAFRYLVVIPPVPVTIRPAYRVLAGAAVESLPGWARRELRLPRVPVVEAVAIRPANEVLSRVLRWALVPAEPIDGR
jgi:uncharacterized protein (DUF2236 family)